MNRNRVHLIVDILAYLVMVGLASTGLLLAYRLPPGTGGRHGGGRGALTVLGRSRHEWGDIHWYLAIALVALVVLHVVLHWKWVTNSLGALFAVRGVRKPGAGLGGAVTLLALALVGAGVAAAPWLAGVQERERGGRGAGGGYRGGRAQRADAPKADPGDDELSCDTCTVDCPSAAKATTATSAAPAEAPRKGPGGHGGQVIRGRTTLAEAAQEAGVAVVRLIAALDLPANTSPNARLGQLRQQHGFEIEDVRAVVTRLKDEAAKAPR